MKKQETVKETTSTPTMGRINEVKIHANGKRTQTSLETLSQFNSLLEEISQGYARIKRTDGKVFCIHKPQSVGEALDIFPRFWKSNNSTIYAASMPTNLFYVTRQINSIKYFVYAGTLAQCLELINLDHSQYVAECKTSIGDSFFELFRGFKSIENWSEVNLKVKHEHPVIGNSYLYEYSHDMKLIITTDLEGAARLELLVPDGECYTLIRLFVGNSGYLRTLAKRVPQALIFTDAEFLDMKDNIKQAS